MFNEGSSTKTMADLSVEFVGVKFKNLTLIATSSLPNHVEKLRRLNKQEPGALVISLVTMLPDR